MFRIQNLSKKFDTSIALNDISMTIHNGMNFIVGPSGSGKSTLLKILSCMDKEYIGNVYYQNKDLKTYTKEEKSALYHNEFGFVWQDFHLLEDATVLENIMLPTYLKESFPVSKAQRILKELNIEDIKDKKIKKLSGGQKQRVAIARELMKEPKVIFCDEPTSALDTKTTKAIMNVLRNYAKKRCVVMVTHDTSLIYETDHVFELNKGELIKNDSQKEANSNQHLSKTTHLSMKSAMQLTLMNLKNKIVQVLISVFTIFLAASLLSMGVSKTTNQQVQNEFDQLLSTYGPGILDISLCGSFMSAAGGENQQNGSVNQDLSGLFEKYQNDSRVDFIILSQAFENIQIGLDGKTYTIENTGNTPVLTKLISGSIPFSKENQVVVPLKFVQDLGLSNEEVLGKNIRFDATVFQWVNNQPIEKPVQIDATICGVADNTVVYDYQGKTYSFTVDDSFFFNQVAINELRSQAGIDEKPANFTLRAKTPEDLIALRDEFNQSGIVPLGRFELVEDIVSLNQKTNLQSSLSSSMFVVLSFTMTIIVFYMTSLLRKKENAIYLINGYQQKHLALLSLFEILVESITALVVLLMIQPSLVTLMSVCIIFMLSFIIQLPNIMHRNLLKCLKAGEKA